MGAELTPSWPKQCKPAVITATNWQGQDCLLITRVRSVDGTYLQQSAVQSIALTVYDQLANRQVILGPLSLTVAAVVFNALQQNPVLWPVDAIGYNFLYRISGALAFPSWQSKGLAEPTEGESWVDVIATLTDGSELIMGQWDISTLPVP